jgi:hypothetical protein
MLNHNPDSGDVHICLAPDDFYMSMLRRSIDMIMNEKSKKHPVNGYTDLDLNTHDDDEQEQEQLNYNYIITVI